MLNDFTRELHVHCTCSVLTVTLWTVHCVSTHSVDVKVFWSAILPKDPIVTPTVQKFTSLYANLNLLTCKWLPTCYKRIKSTPSTTTDGSITWYLLLSILLLPFPNCFTRFHLKADDICMYVYIYIRILLAFKYIYIYIYM